MQRLFMNDLEWKPYPQDRLIAQHPQGFSIIVPKDFKGSIPVNCPVCDTLFRSSDDETAYQEFKCCNTCAMQWAHARKIEWNTGWRPSREQVLDSVKDRLPPFIALDVD